MKKIILALILTGFCFQAFAEVTSFQPSEESVKEADYGRIDAKGLKILIDSPCPFILLDARGNKWHDQNIIPGALLASYESSEEELEMIIPDKDVLIVVYCYSSTCPLATRLVQKLLHLGYKNLIEYPGGLKEWRDEINYPVDVIYNE